MDCKVGLICKAPGGLCIWLHRFRVPPDLSKLKGCVYAAFSFMVFLIFFFFSIIEIEGILFL